MKIQDTDAALGTSDDSDQAAENLLHVLEDVESNPEVAAYHGIDFKFQGHTFLIDPQGWVFTIGESGEQPTGRQINRSALNTRREQWLKDGNSS